MTDVELSGWILQGVYLLGLLYVCFKKAHKKVEKSIILKTILLLCSSFEFTAEILKVYIPI